MLKMKAATMREKKKHQGGTAKILKHFNMDDLKIPQPFRMQISGASG
jgi:hypothetical protein